MSKLRIDLDVLQDTRNIYNDEIEQFRQAKNKIRQALEDLKLSGWDTKAGRLWFGDLGTGWMKAFKEHIEVIQELSDELGIAQTKYQEIVDELNALKNSLN